MPARKDKLLPKYPLKSPHALEADECLEALDSTRDGLGGDEAERRRKVMGPNRLPEPDSQSLLVRFFKHFHDVLIYILLIAALVTALLGHWIDTSVILAVVVINSLIGFFQEGKAEQALAGIRKMLSLHAMALREGEVREVDADELVPGDVVRLRSGDKVPADMRLWEANNLRIEESALTGESVPVEKSPKPVSPDAGVGDRSGMAFSGSIVSSGRGTGVVVATATDTEIGRINRMIEDVEQLATPLTRQMARFGKVLSVVIVFMALVLFAIGYLAHGWPLGELFLASIGFAVAAIPEGLPAILSITLAIGVQRMAERKAITRQLPSVETLGSVTVICSDKTGTLTRNEMTVQSAVTGAARYEVTGVGYAPDGEVELDDEPVDPKEREDLSMLLEIMTVCNDAALREEDGEWVLSGEPTEGALRCFGMKAGFDHEAYERVSVIPFESDNKWMATLDELPEGGRRIHLKGASDRLLDLCGRQAGARGETEPLEREHWEALVEELAADGHRVLAAAYRDAPEESSSLSPDDLNEELVFVGLVGIMDPPRPEAMEAIETCHEAGIRVVMITGDHVATARSIGLQMGIGDGEHAVDGARLEKTSDEDLRALVAQNEVFARTSPEHKLRLVKALQAADDVVAMTGDGVNDAPALKRADVGIAMGIKGSEATKEAADIVLTDDNFASIEHAVEEGRTIYDNLQKAILFLLPTNGAEALVILTAVLAGFALPLTPVQILWVNMVTAVTLAMALAFEPSEPGLMSRPPREPGASIVGAYYIFRVAFVSLLIGGATIAVFLVERELGMSVELARTVAVNTLVAAQLFYLFNSRYLRESSLYLGRLIANRVALGAAGILIVLQLTFVYAPFMNTWFGSEPLELRHWLVPLAIGAGVFLLAELEKAVNRMRRRGES